MSKNATFIILDTSPAMLEVEAAISAFEDMGPDPNSYFCRAKDIAETLLKRKLLANRKRDYVGLLFAGTEQKCLPTAMMSMGDHLTLVSPLAPASLSMAQAIVDQKIENQICDWAGAVEVLLYLFEAHCKKHTYQSKTIIFLTCPSSYHSKASDRERAAKIWDSLKAVGAVLAYVGVSGEPPEPGSPEFESLPLLHQLAAQGGGQALTYDQGRLLAQEVMISPDIRQTACFYGELFVGDRLGLPTVGYLQSKAAECFSFKNCSLNAPHPHITSIVPHVAGRNTETQNKSPSATEGQFVKKEECEVFYSYGSATIPKNLVDAILDDAAQEVFKISKAIRILGFISRDKVKRVHFMEEPILLQARSHPDAFDVLVTSMYRTKKVGIVWYLRSSNITRITFGYLVPCRATSENASYFQFFRIPFSQDVQTSLLPSLDDLPYFVCTPDQPDELKVPGAINLPKPLLEATEEFIHAMMLPLDGQDAQYYNPYKPASLPNPGWMDMLNTIHSRATDGALPSHPNPLLYPELPPSRVPVVNNLKHIFLSLTKKNYTCS